MSLLLAGGHEDPNLTVLADAVKKTDVELLDLRLPASESPAFFWNYQDGTPRLQGKPLRPTGAFIRHDVFGAMKDSRTAVSSRAMAWYQTVNGWLLSDPGIRIFNREMLPAAMNKPASLIFAREAGLRTPQTWITNEPGSVTNNGAKVHAQTMIAKPVLGGDYCYSLEDALKKTALRNGLGASPAIVQTKLVAPEVRIYVIGQMAFAFELRSGSLDYRVNQDAEVVPLAEVPKEVTQLRKLMARLGMDFGAADFKTDPDTGELVFLELNTGPMFARFDHESGGKVCAAIIHELTAAPEKR